MDIVEVGLSTDHANMPALNKLSEQVSCGENADYKEKRGGKTK